MQAAEFIDRIARSNLRDEAGLRRLLASAPKETRADAGKLADWLVERKVLTTFQANNLLLDQWRGLVVDGFELRDVLGKGGMGTVYLAHDRRRGRPCALKVLPAEKRTHARNVRRFLRETTVGQRLEHPNIAASYLAGNWRGVPYLVMEYVPGVTLYRLARAGGQIPPANAVKWIAELAGALDYIHQHGIVHRDLKPSNVIITPSGKAKLLDLGLARWYEDDHNEHLVVGERRMVGSFDYMAPEQASNSARADPRSDIYGLGCLLYFALVGKPPFHHVELTRDKIAHHQGVYPEPVTKARPDVPPGLAAVLARLMAKNPAERYQVAEEARQVLEGWEARLAPKGTAPFRIAFAIDDEIPSSDEPVIIDERFESAIDLPALAPKSPGVDPDARAGAGNGASWERILGVRWTRRVGNWFRRGET